MFREECSRTRAHVLRQRRVVEFGIGSVKYGDKQLIYYSLLDILDMDIACFRCWLTFASVCSFHDIGMVAVWRSRISL